MQVSLAERVSVLKDVVLNLQIENAFAGLAPELAVVTIAVGQLQTSDHFTGYPATRALEITSPHRHEAAEALQRVVCNMKPRFYFDFAVSIADSLC